MRLDLALATGVSTDPAGDDPLAARLSMWLVDVALETAPAAIHPRPRSRGRARGHLQERSPIGLRDQRTCAGGRKEH